MVILVDSVGTSYLYNNNMLIIIIQSSDVSGFCILREKKSYTFTFYFLYTKIPCEQQTALPYRYYIVIITLLFCFSHFSSLDRFVTLEIGVNSSFTDLLILSA